MASCTFSLTLWPWLDGAPAASGEAGGSASSLLQSLGSRPSCPGAAWAGVGRVDRSCAASQAASLTASPRSGPGEEDSMASCTLPLTFEPWLSPSAGCSASSTMPSWLSTSLSRPGPLTPPPAAPAPAVATMRSGMAGRAGAAGRGGGGGRRRGLERSERLEGLQVQLDLLLQIRVEREAALDVSGLFQKPEALGKTSLVLGHRSPPP